MKPGSKPKTRHLHVLQGTHRKDRHAGQDLSGGGSIPDPPDYLPELAREFWLEVRPLLERMGVGEEGDRYSLEGMSILWDQYRTALEHQKEHGMLYWDEKREAWKKSDAVIVIQQNLKELRIQTEAAGISLPGRVRFGGQADESNEEDDFIFGT